MKSILLAATLLSSHVYAQGKCHQAARTAAFHYAYDNGYAESQDQFRVYFGDEHLQVDNRASSKQEFWSFSDGSKFFHVTVEAVGQRCFVRDVFMGQNDQDGE